MVWVGLTPMPTGTPNLSQIYFQRKFRSAPPPPPPAYQLFWELRDYGLGGG